MSDTADATAPITTGKEKWETSRAKATLRRELIEGLIPRTGRMEYREIYNRNLAIHQKWSYERWRDNLYALRRAFNRELDRRDHDAAAYEKDKQILASRGHLLGGPKPWHLTECPRLLKEDFANGLFDSLAPQELYLTRDEYQDLDDLAIFRRHMYQMKNQEPKRAARFEKKKKRAKYPELLENHPRAQDNEL